MNDFLNRFKVELVPGSVQRLTMDDATYFGPLYKDYVSNSKLALICPEQDGHPKKYSEGFKKPTVASFFDLGSAVHQLTLEPEIYKLSRLKKPGGKLANLCQEFEKLTRESGDYENLIKTIDPADFVNVIKQDPDLLKLLHQASQNADYYAKNSKEDKLAKTIETGLENMWFYFKANKPKTSKEGKSFIYLDKTNQAKCDKCIASVEANEDIQKALRWNESYNEDVIVAEVKISFPKDFNGLMFEDEDMHSVNLKLKMKADNWTIDHDKKEFVLNDLKTTGKDVTKFMGYNYDGKFYQGSWDNFHYSRQMGEMHAPLYRKIY